MGTGQLGLDLQRGRRTLLSLNSRQIAQLISEVEPKLIGLRLRDIQALPPRDLVLIFEPEDAGDGPAVFRLRISADPDNSRLHLQQGRLHRGKGPTGKFFRKLEEELTGSKLKKLTQVRADRIVLLEFNETPSGKPRSLLAELTGRHGNLLLLDRGDLVLDLLIPAPKKQEQPRLVIGETWSPPPGQAPAKSDVPSVEDQFLVPEDDPPGRKAGHPELAPLSWRVEGVLGKASEDRDQDAERKRVRKRIERKQSRARSLHNGLTKKLEACDRAERVRLDGELLSANLHQVKRGAKFVELEDWYEDGTPLRRIDLDPRRTPQENASHHFERYKKLERSKLEIPSELALAKEKLAGLDALLLRIEDLTTDPIEVDQEGVKADLLDPQQVADPRKRKVPEARIPYRKFITESGLEVRVGRNARDNDALTFRHANGNDIWLHTADAPGSHVILRLGKGAAKKGQTPEPNPEDLHDAAALAVHFSPLRGAMKADVHVAPCKLVHKPRGAKPGLVTLSGGRNMQVRMQPERLKRLLRPERSQ